MSEDDGLKGQVIQIDEARIRDHLGEMVRGTVEETLNALLDAEADRLCGAGHHRGAVGYPCQPEHGVEPEPEDLRQDRGLAEPAD
jgi:hypothetical protein